MSLRKSARRRPQNRYGCAGGRLFGRGARSESGLFGIESGIMIAFLTVTATAICLGLIVAIPWIVEEIGKGADLAPLLVHVPGMAGQPMFRETIVSELGALESGKPAGIFTVSTVMGDLYAQMQRIAFVGFIIAAILLGITYISEQFNLVSKGTAFQLLSESGLILILLFIFPIIYNVSAAAVNILNQQVILSGTSASATATPRAMINTVIHGATSFGARGLSWDMGGNIAAVLASMMQGTVAFGAVLTAVMAGIGRLLILGILVGAFPIILIFRLIPPLRNIAATLQGALIGLLVGTILASLVIRVSWGVLCAGLSPVAAWAFGCGTLVTLSLVTFIVAAGFGGISRAMQGAVVGPASAVVGGMIAAGGGMAIGGATGGGAAALATRGLGLSGRQRLEVVAAGMRAGERVGLRGPLAGLTGGPSAGLEAERAVRGKQIDEETMKMGESPLSEQVAGSAGNETYKQARAKLADVWKASSDGKRLFEQLQGGEMPLFQRRRMTAVARLMRRQPEREPTLREIVEEEKGLERSGFKDGDYTRALESGYYSVKSRAESAVRSAAHSAGRHVSEKEVTGAGEREARIWLSALARRASEGRYFAEEYRFAGTPGSKPVREAE